MNKSKAIMIMTKSSKLIHSHIRHTPNLNTDVLGEKLMYKCKAFNKYAFLKVKKNNITMAYGKKLLEKFKELSYDFHDLVESNSGKIKEKDGSIIKSLTMSTLRLESFFKKPILTNHSFFKEKKNKPKESDTLPTTNINQENNK